MSETLQHLDTTQLVALAAALGWASGLRLYAVVAITGLVGYAGWIELPEGLKVLQHPAVLVAAAAMLFVEFFADKIPWFDSLWDAVHTFIRIPAGAALAAGVFGADSASMATVAALLGGTLAATSHFSKATTRAALNTSPEPFSNVAMSLLGDLTVPAMMWLALEHTTWFFVLLALALVLMVVLTIVLWKFLRVVLQGIRKLIDGGQQPAMRS
jgi:hypothetical protein